MTHLKKLLYCVVLGLAATALVPPPISAQTPVPIPISGSVTDISGTPVPDAYLSVQLQNCVGGTPRVTGYSGIVQLSYKFVADGQGRINGTIWPNDVITCTTTTGASMYAVTVVSNDLPVGQTQCYQPVSTMGVWNTSVLQPIACSQTPPNPQDLQVRNLNVTGMLTDVAQFSGTSATFSGNITAGTTSVSGTGTFGSISTPNLVPNVLGLGMKCDYLKTDGTVNPTPTDDTIAMQALLNGTHNYGTLVLPPNSSCMVSSLTIPSTGNGINLDLNQSTLRLTGTGGGACGNRANGLIKILQDTGPHMFIRNGFISTPNSTTSCAINMSATSWAQGLTVEKVTFLGSTSTTNSNTGFYMFFGGNTHIDNNVFVGYASPIVFAGGQINSVSVHKNVLAGNAGTTYLIQIDGAQAVTISENDCETYSCLQAVNSHTLKVTANWAGDGSPTTPWFYIHTAVAGTADISNNFMYDPAAIGIQTAGTFDGAITITSNEIFGSTKSIVSGLVGQAPGTNSVNTRITGNYLGNEVDLNAGGEVFESNRVNGSVILNAYANDFSAWPNYFPQHIANNVFYGGQVTCTGVGGNYIEEPTAYINGNCLTAAQNNSIISSSAPIMTKATTSINGTDLNTLTINGWYSGNSIVNGPAAFGTGFMKVFVMAAAPLGGTYLTQNAYDLSGGSNKFWTRNYNGLVWTGWVAFNASQHIRGSVGCTTAASVGASCATSTPITWPVPFPDTNYSLVCTADVLPSQVGFPVIYAISKTATNFLIGIVATSATASSTGFDCIAMHD